MKIGIDLGGSHIAIGVVDNEGRIVEKIEKRLTSKEKKNLTKSIVDYIIENVKQFKDKYKITKMGMAIPGRAKDGVIIDSGNLGIENYPIVEKLQELELPIQIRNDAKCAALAENTYGCLKEYNISIFLTLGTGIGGATFLDGKLLKAGIRPGYEFGHMVIQKNGIECNCGRKGCFEKYASMKAFKNNLREVLKLDKKVRGDELLKIINEVDSKSSKYNMIENVVSEFIEDLSTGICNLINIFEPEIIGIGGSFVYFKDIFLGRLKQKIKQENSKRLGRQEILIETAKLGNDAGIIGATLSSLL